MGDIRIRFGKVEERQELEDLQRRASLAIAKYRAALTVHPDAIELPAQHLTSGSTIVAERGRAICGFAVVLPRHDCEAELDGLFVDPDMWRAGIGRRLVTASASLAHGRGAQFLCVTANTEAVVFYESCGFEVVGEAETRFGPAPLMQLGLGKAG
jgi:ribosomal protein S18 acetylase RimI-like enzyme